MSCCWQHKTLFDYLTKGVYMAHFFPKIYIIQQWPQSKDMTLASKVKVKILRICHMAYNVNFSFIFDGWCSYLAQ